MKLWEYRDHTVELVWYEDGKIFREANRSGEFYDGEFRQYFRNGNLSQKGRYDAGYRVGTWHYYYPDGKYYLIINYKKEPVNHEVFFINGSTGNENGEYFRFYPWGILEEEGFYEGGKYHGKRIRYLKDGSKHFEFYYIHGRLVQAVYYEGNLVKKIMKSNMNH